MKRSISAALAIAAVAMIGGCATSASKVVAVDVPASRYAALDCQAARTELAAKLSAEAELARRQDTAATRDAAGVAFIGLPVGSLMRGDVAGDLAQVKGEVRALQLHIAGRCQA